MSSRGPARVSGLPLIPGSISGNPEQASQPHRSARAGAKMRARLAVEVRPQRAQALLRRLEAGGGAVDCDADGHLEGARGAEDGGFDDRVRGGAVVEERGENVSAAAVDVADLRWREEASQEVREPLGAKGRRRVGLRAGGGNRRAWEFAMLSTRMALLSYGLRGSRTAQAVDGWGGRRWARQLKGSSADAIADDAEPRKPPRKCLIGALSSIEWKISTE